MTRSPVEEILMMRYNRRRRTGSILPLLAISIVALLGLVAMGVDIGMVAVARTQAQDAADLSALAGARMLNGDTSNSGNLNNINNAIATAQDRADDNRVLTQLLTPAQILIRTGVYNYDSAAAKFSPSYPSTPGSNAWSVMEVTIHRN